MSDEYVVYGLEDPRDKLYHYIGITNDVYRRFNEHVTGSSGNIEKNSWIFECRQAKIMIAMHEIERLATVEEATQREKHWIAHYYGLGHPLHNSAIPGKKAVVEPGKYTLKKSDAQREPETFYLVSKGNRIIGREILQLEAWRNSSPFHLYPLTFGLLAAIFCTTGASMFFLATWIVFGLVWSLVAGCGMAYLMIVLSALLYLYMYSLELVGKQKQRKEEGHATKV